MFRFSWLGFPSWTSCPRTRRDPRDRARGTPSMSPSCCAAESSCCPPLPCYTHTSGRGSHPRAEGLPGAHLQAHGLERMLRAFVPDSGCGCVGAPPVGRCPEAAGTASSARSSQDACCCCGALFAPCFPHSLRVYLGLAQGVGPRTSTRSAVQAREDALRRGGASVRWRPASHGIVAPLNPSVVRARRTRSSKLIGRRRRRPPREKPRKSSTRRRRRPRPWPPPAASLSHAPLVGSGDGDPPRLDARLPLRRPPLLRIVEG